jgi:signal recognition particle receptor subunit beta
MAQYKIIFTGPESAGKTTAIHAISDAPPIKSDTLVVGLTEAIKSSTTSAIDYRILNLINGEEFCLYEMHGQEQFEFMRNILSAGGGGMILLLDNSKADPFKDLWFYWDIFKKFVPEANVAIGITHMDISDKPTIADYHAQLLISGLKPPIFAVDARAQKDVFVLVQSLLYSNDIGLVK